MNTLLAAASGHAPEAMTPREIELENQLAQCQEALACSWREVEWLRQKIDLLVRRIFGSSSEQIDPAQLELLLQQSASTPVIAEKPATEKTIKPSSASSREKVAVRQHRLPENLPVIEEVIEPEPIKAAPEQ